MTEEMDRRQVLRVRLRALLPWDAFWKTQLAAMYATGDGVPKDEWRAARLYRKAARRGSAEAQFNLGFMYLLGEGVPPDRGAGKRWLELAARQGHDQAVKLLKDPRTGLA
jgi:TPR repeat protein